MGFKMSLLGVFGQIIITYITFLVLAKKTFWVLRAPQKPLVYIPNYDAVLVPAQDFSRPHALPAVQALAGVLPFQPPRRRRPILAILDMLQKRYNLQAANLAQADGSSPLEINFGDLEAAEDSSSSTRTSTTTEETKVDNEEVVDEIKPSPETNSDDSKINMSETSKDVLGSQNSEMIPQLSRIYTLLDSLTKDHPDLNNGFSYAFKYRVPHASPKLDGLELSVQQSLNRFPQISENPLEHRVFKTPIDYQKAQEKLDSILEESSKKGVPVHLNTPGAFGPLLLNQYLESVPKEKKESETVVVEATEGRRQNPTKLLLRPVAKAVAGPMGIAVASPIAKAVLRRGQPVTLEFEPDAVAIAGPGGQAHSHPEFSIDYIESKESHT